MRQVEITTKVKNSMEEINEVLIKKGFEIIRKSRIEDKYLVQNPRLNSKDEIEDTINKSVLVRYLNTNGEETKKITYKNKKYENKKLQYEEKTSVKIDNVSNAIAIFEKLGFEKIVEVDYNCIVYSNGNVEFAIQDVEKLGILLEYENLEDFQNASTEEIEKTKKEMLEEVKKTGLNVSEDTDIRKAYELLK